MDCEAFFALVDARLGDRYAEPTRTAVGDQCVVEFFHPRVVERLGTDNLVTRFNRSGVVWAPRATHLKVKLRVTDPHGDAVAAALARAPLSFSETDHRVVSAGGGELVTVLHFTASTDGVSASAVEATLDAVAEALAV